MEGMIRFCVDPFGVTRERCDDAPGLGGRRWGVKVNVFLERFHEVTRQCLA